MSANTPEGAQVTVTLPLLTWYRLIAAARHGEQEMFRIIRDDQYPGQAESLRNARSAWLDSIAALTEQLANGEIR